jgi:hypothetical protein
MILYPPLQWDVGTHVPLPGVYPVAQPPLPPAEELPPAALETALQTPLLATVPAPQVVGAAVAAVAELLVELPQPLLLPQPTAAPIATAPNNAVHRENLIMRPPCCGLSIV